MNLHKNILVQKVSELNEEDWITREVIAFKKSLRAENVFVIINRVQDNKINFFGSVKRLFIPKNSEL